MLPARLGVAVEETLCRKTDCGYPPQFLTAPKKAKGKAYFSLSALVFEVRCQHTIAHEKFDCLSITAIGHCPHFDLSFNPFSRRVRLECLTTA